MAQRRRTSNQRNLLYQESISWWGIIGIGVFVLAVVVVVLGLFLLNAAPS